ncbi:MAG: hypothetical protein AAF358_13680 [Pseudomonadota bacterium]
MNVRLELAYATAQWALGSNDDDWVVVSETGEHLWQLPGKLSDREIMSAVRMGREFELKAFNIGIEFGKKQEKELSERRIAHLEGQIRTLEAMNSELSAHLERHIGGE